MFGERWCSVFTYSHKQWLRYVAIVSVKQTRELKKPTFSCSSIVFCVQLINARLALCLASDGVLSLPIRVTMVALLRSNSFCQTNAGTQETDFQLLF